MITRFIHETKQTRYIISTHNKKINIINVNIFIFFNKIKRQITLF